MEQRARAGMAGEAARDRSGKEVSAAADDAWRPGGIVGQSIPLPLERPAVRGRWICGDRTELPWLVRVRDQVPGLDQGTVGRRAVRGSDEGRGPRVDVALRRQ